MTQQLKLDEEDATAAMLTKCVTVDGEPVNDYKDFDKLAWPDYVFLVGQYNAWSSTEGSKN